MADREWTYVAASRSRFSTTLYVNRGALATFDIDSHQPSAKEAGSEDRAHLVERLAFGMSRARPKGTALDWAAPVEKADFMDHAHAPAPPHGARVTPAPRPGCPTSVPVPQSSKAHSASPATTRGESELHLGTER
jgi:hypothetical protein